MGTPLTFAHALMLGTLLLPVSANLVCKSLHWRLLLAPGGPHQGRLGLHTALGTTTFYLATAGLTLGLGVVAACVFLDHPAQVFTFIATQFGPLPFDLMCAIAVGTLIRGTRHPMRWYILLAALRVAF